MRCQSRNRRSSATLGFQRPASYPFHHPHPAVHRTSSYSENSSRLSLRKTLLSCLNDLPAKVFLSFRRQRASILVSHADTLAHYFWTVIYIMLRLVNRYLLPKETAAGEISRTCPVIFDKRTTLPPGPAL